MVMIRNLLAIRLMIWALQLVSRKDDARSLRIAIPLTIAMAESMEGVNAKALEPHAAAIRMRLGELRDKLARLEGAEAAVA